MPIFDLAFLEGVRIDELLFDILIWFGWIPIAIVLVWGGIMMFQNHRQGIYASRRRYVLLGISVPAMTEQSPKALENLFQNMYGTYSSLTFKEKWFVGKFQSIFSFEIASVEGRIAFYVRTEIRYRDLIEAGIYAHYPEAEIYEVEDYAAWAPTEYPNDEWEVWGSELKLKEDNYLPIRTYIDFEDRLTQELKDPLGQMLELLGKMRPGEHFYIQFVFQPAHNSWKDGGVKYIKKQFGQDDAPKTSAIDKAIRASLALPSAVLEEALGISLVGQDAVAAEEDIWKAFRMTPQEKEQVDAVLRKISKTGFNVKTRLVYLARKEVFDKQARTALVKGMLNQYSHGNLNGIGMYGPTTPKDDYFWMIWQYAGKQRSLVSAYKSRSYGIGANPSLFNAEELATLWHFPTVGIKAPLVEKALSRRAEPPPGLPTAPIGETDELQPPPSLPQELPTEPPANIPIAPEPIAPAPVTPNAAPPEELPGLRDIPVEVRTHELPQEPGTVPQPKRPTKPTGGGDVPPNLPV